MLSYEPRNNNSQQAESVELIPLAPLLENADPDFDVVVERRNASIRGRIKRAIDELRPSPPPNPESKRA